MYSNQWGFPESDFQFFRGQLTLFSTYFEKRSSKKTKKGQDESFTTRHPPGDFLWHLWEMLSDSKRFVMATFVSAGRLHRRSWSNLAMIYQRNSCRKTGSYAPVMKPDLLLPRTRLIPTKRTRLKTSVYSSSFATCDQRLHSTSADVNGSLGKEFMSLVVKDHNYFFKLRIEQ